MIKANNYEAQHASSQYNSVSTKSYVQINKNVQTENTQTKKEKDFCCLKLLSHGRIGRTQYFLSTTGITVVGLVLFALFSVIPTIGMPLAFIYLAGMLIFNLFLTVQRCHDINASGWLCLTSFVPFLSSFLYFIPGTKGNNKYGLKPVACCSEAKAGAFVLATLMIMAAIVTLSLYEYPVVNSLNTDNLIALVN